MKILFRVKFVLLLILFCTNATAVDFDGKLFQIKSKFSQDCMELENSSNKDGIKLILYPCSADSLQKLLFTKKDDGFYTITANSGKKLTLSNEEYFITQTQKGTSFKIEVLDDAYILRAKDSKEYITANVRSGKIIKSQKNNQYSQMWYLIE